MAEEKAPDHVWTKKEHHTLDWKLANEYTAGLHPDAEEKVIEAQTESFMEAYHTLKSEFKKKGLEIGEKITGEKADKHLNDLVFAYVEPIIRDSLGEAGKALVKEYKDAKFESEDDRFGYLMEQAKHHLGFDEEILAGLKQVLREGKSMKTIARYLDSTFGAHIRKGEALKKMHSNAYQFIFAKATPKEIGKYIKAHPFIKERYKVLKDNYLGNLTYGRRHAVINKIGRGQTFTEDERKALGIEEKVLKYEEKKPAEEYKKAA